MSARPKLTIEQVNWAIDCGLPTQEVANTLGISKSLTEKIFYGLSRYTTRRRPKPETKFTDEQIQSIRADTRMQKDIAAEYGCARSLISGIKSYLNYGHVPGPDSRPSKRPGRGRKLTTEQIQEMQAPENQHRQLKYWALTYGVSITTIFHAINGFSYKELNPEKEHISEGA